MQVKVENVNVERLADQVLDDLRRRGLRPGDRYSTAAEAARQFNASEISMHRAMQLLARRKWLVRQRRAGTFVGPMAQPPTRERSPLRIVHLVISMDYERVATLPVDELVMHFQSTLHGAVVQMHYVPTDDGVRHLEHLVQQIKERPAGTEGIVLLRSSRPMQVLMEQSQVPAVVYGSVYPGVPRLAWLDADQKQIGREMARYALTQGHRKMFLIMRDNWRPGDNDLFNSILEELGQAKLNADALTVASIPPQREHIEDVVGTLLDSKPDVTAVLCRTHAYAAAALAVVSERMQSNKFCVIAGGGRFSGRPSYTYVKPQISEPAQIEMLAKMLLEVVQNSPDLPQSQRIPVKLVVSH